MNSRDGKLRLMDRDFQLFEYLFITKGALRTQIQRDIFGGASSSSVNDRLTKLTKHGMIKPFSAWFGRCRSAFYLSPATVKDFKLFNGEARRSELKTSNPSHEFSLIEIRNKLLQCSGLQHYLTENQLQSGLYDGKFYNYDEFIQLNCDAFLRVKIEGAGEFSGAIEYEQSIKGISRYRELFAQFYLAYNIKFVFYIVSSDKIKNTILEIDKGVKGKRDSKIFVITFANMKNAPGYLALKNSDNNILELNLSKIEQSKI